MDCFVNTMYQIYQWNLKRVKVGIFIPHHRSKTHQYLILHVYTWDVAFLNSMVTIQLFCVTKWPFCSIKHLTKDSVVVSLVTVGWITLIGVNFLHVASLIVIAMLHSTLRAPQMTFRGILFPEVKTANSLTWKPQMETLSALLAIYAGNSPVTGEFPSQRPVTRCFGVLFDRGLNKRFSKQSRRWWFETLSCSLWRHCNDMLQSALERRWRLCTTDVADVI